MIFFQDKLLNIINSFNLNTLPHTILIGGEYGSGKHTIANYISSRFDLSLLDITDNLNNDTITEIYTSNIPSFYLIDSDQISIKDQNTILKFLEEPCSNAFILVLNSNGLLLDTIQNRCFRLKLGIYSRRMLETFALGFENDQLILDVARTPGQVIDYMNEDFKGMYEFAQLLFKHIRTANFSNCLTISNKISFNGEDDKSKYSINTFSRILLYLSTTLDTVTYKYTNILLNDLQIPKINKRLIFESFLLNLKYRYE